MSHSCHHYVTAATDTSCTCTHVHTGHPSVWDPTVKPIRSVILARQIFLEPSVDDAADDVDGTTGAVVAECGASPRCIGWRVHLLSGIVYVSESIGLDLVSEVERICREQVGTNSSTKSVYLNRYEDEEPCESCRNPAVSWKVVTFLFLLFT